MSSTKKTTSIIKKGLFYFVRFFPFLLGLAVAILFWLIAPVSADVQVAFKRTLDIALKINTGLVGFFLTIYVVISGIDTRAMKAIRQSNQYSRLIRNLKETIILQFICLLLILTSSLVDIWQLPYSNYDRAFMSITSFFVVAALVSGVQFTISFLSIIDGDPRNHS